MATVINNPSSDGGNNSGMLLGVILLIVVVVLFLYFGLPFMRGGGAGTGGQPSASGSVKVNPGK